MGGDNCTSTSHGKGQEERTKKVMVLKPKRKKKYRKLLSAWLCNSDTKPMRQGEVFLKSETHI